MVVANSAPACLFSSIEFFINSIQLQDLSLQTYPIKHWLETTLSYSKGTKNTLCACEIYYPEAPGEAKATKADGENTPSLTKRKKLIAKSKEVFFNMRLAIDALGTDRFIPPSLVLKWRLIRSRSNYGLIYDPGSPPNTKHYMTKLLSLKLQVRKIFVQPSIRANYFNTLKSGKDAFLPFKQTKVSQIFL